MIPVTNLPDFYCIQATYHYHEDGWNRMGQVPTFYLSTKVQGITSAEHAVEIATEVLMAGRTESSAWGFSVTASPLTL